ncbi:ABC transporter ATP-binding protein [Pseudooceanicola algae]|uniref:Lipopolysaccharide export system ATP-binding protein LptB n=1 Tax=Pseudooceanicola algae TaxID=1537215 RepID=A0A418SJ13_9RHOB|nr:ABC transporter ATP-binding protein [Pseudooceanicola algae]QPM91997.1 Lipopolysaccharide export system ATP-binding protein LptB [Pseudooceanicola algae]
MTANLLEVSQATVQFGGVVALDRVDLTVREGQTMAILGPNGAGKTTLFNVVAGVVPPSQGSIRLGDTDVTKATSSLRSAKGIARTFQITQPFSGLTVIENVMVAIVSRGQSMAAARDEAAEYVEFVGLSAKLDEPARTLSTGQRKRLELARALATKPRLLLLDEVTGGVDRPSIPQILDLIRRLREERGITVLVVEHNMEVLFGLADEAIFLNRGKVLVTGTMQEVAEHAAVRSIYLGDSDA